MAEVSSHLSDLNKRLATSCTGYGAVIDGVLNVRTVSDTAQTAALNTFALCGFRILYCEDPDCDCLVRGLAEIRPDIKIIPVKVEAV